MYTLTGPNEKMRPEKKVELKEEDRRKPELPKPEKLVHVPKLKIRYLGERPSGRMRSYRSSSRKERGDLTRMR